MVFRCGAQRQHGLFPACCICDWGWIVSCTSRSLISTLALLDIANTKARRLGCCSHLLGSNMLEDLVRQYVSPLVSRVTSNLPAVTLGVPRLDRLHPGSSCGCNPQFRFSSVTASHLFIGPGYCCPHSGFDDPAMLLCMSQNAFWKVVVLTF